jgi:hypothetical protein
MSQTTTLVLLPQTTWNGNVSNVQIYDVVGVKNPAASYYVGSKDLQTINVNQVGLTGNIIVQATLATLPEITDWFQVYKLEANAGAPANSELSVNSSVNEAVNIVGNFVWMRAIIQDFNGGILQYVKVSY